MSQPKPTVGRVVLFKSSNADLMGNGAKVVPAIVVAVWSDTCVNLRVLSDGPNSPWVTSVNFAEDIDAFTPQFSVQGEGPSAWIGHSCAWGWMPYQKAVHAGEIEATKHAA